MAFVLEDVEVEDRPIACGQLAHHSVDFLWRNVADGWIDVFWLVSQLVVQEQQFVSFRVSQEPQRLVDYDSRGPCPE